MAMFRVNKTRDYSVLSNIPLKDQRLSFAAKGMLCVMLSKPNQWIFSESGLSKTSTNGISSVRSIVRELKETGYLTITKERDTKGRITGCIYNIYESPISNPEYDFPRVDNPRMDKPNMDIPHTDNRTVINTNNNKVLNNQILNKVNTDSDFDNAWDKYPKHTNRKSAIQEYNKALTKTDPSTIINGIVRYANYVKSHNIDMRYIKQFTSWLKEESWNDEYEDSNDWSFLDYVEGDPYE